MSDGRSKKSIARSRRTFSSEISPVWAAALTKFVSSRDEQEISHQLERSATSQISDALLQPVFVSSSSFVSSGNASRVRSTETRLFFSRCDHRTFGAYRSEFRSSVGMSSERDSLSSSSAVERQGSSSFPRTASAVGRRTNSPVRIAGVRVAVHIERHFSFSLHVERLRSIANKYNSLVDQIQFEERDLFQEKFNDIDQVGPERHSLSPSVRLAH